MEEFYEIVDDFGNKVKEARTKQKKTQKQFASEVHMSQQAISKIEKGAMIPTLDRIPDFMKALGITLLAPVRKMGEKAFEDEVNKTEDCEMFTINGQNIILTNDEYLHKNNNIITNYIRKHDTYDLLPQNIILDLFYFIRSDNDILTFADIVEEETGMSKTGKMLMMSIMSYLYHYCECSMYTIDSISSLTRAFDKEDSSSKCHLDCIFDHFEKESPYSSYSFAVKMFRSVQIQDIREQKSACIEIADFFSFGDLYYESKNETMKWLFDYSNRLMKYIYDTNVENKIIMIHTKDEKYGNVVYKFLKHILKNEQNTLGSDRIKYWQKLSEDIKNYKAKNEEEKRNEEKMNKEKNEEKYSKDIIMHLCEEDESSWGLENLPYMK